MDLVVLVGVVVVTMVSVRFTRAYLDRRPARRALASAPPLAPTSAEGTFVCVTGIVRAGDATITAPLSARPCVVARARFRMKEGGFFGIGTHPYVTFAMVPFFVEVPLVGRIRVESRYASLDMRPRKMSKRRSAPGSRERMLADHLVTESARNSPSFDETIVEPGALVAVAGILMKNVPLQPDTAEKGYRDSVAPTFVLQGTVDQPVVIAVGEAHSRR